MPASRTALVAAAVRAQHLRLDDPPPILDDYLAERLLGSDAPGLLTTLGLLPSDVQSGLRASITSRCRVTEDRAVAAASLGPARYVALGAGLDSVAWRHSEVDLEVVEIDLPESAEDKMLRIRGAGLPAPAARRVVACNLSAEPLVEVFRGAGLHDDRRMVIAWLGVTQYLPLAAVAETLAAVAMLPAGSEIVLTTITAESELPPERVEDVRTVQAIAEASGEPWITRPTRVELTQMISDAGLVLIGPAASYDHVRDYFDGRTDGLMLQPVEPVTVARVP